MQPSKKQSKKSGKLIKDGNTKINKIIERYNWHITGVAEVNHKYNNFHTSLQENQKQYNYED